MYLARVYPETKFLRARASVLGFASTPKAQQQPTPRTRPRTIPGQYTDDDDYGGSDDDENEDDDGNGMGVDTDVLPTMLVYRGGDLVHNWVRVDWEAGQAGIEELLSK